MSSKSDLIIAPPGERKPLGIEDYGLIGDMHTCALVGSDGSLDFCCWPSFDSPSLFARVLDTTAGGGGHWSIQPTVTDAVVKQSYVPSTNILQTKWINQEGVVLLKDFFVIRKQGHDSPTLVRRLQCIRGSMEIDIEVAPAPNYAQPPGGRHAVKIEGPELVVPSSAQLDKATSPGLCQTIKWTASPAKASSTADESYDLVLDIQLSPSDDADEEDLGQHAMFKVEDNHGVLCDKVKATLTLKEGQRVTMVLHHQKYHFGTIRQGSSKAEAYTRDFWTRWARKCQYSGLRTEQVQRSLLALKLLTYQPTGAIIAAPTFGLPESIGGQRNWDYRYSWVRDSSFTVYVFLKMGYTEEAEAYMNFIFERIAEWQAEGDPSVANGAVTGAVTSAANGHIPSVAKEHHTRAGARKHLPLMFRIDGSHTLDEVSLPHLGGYKDSTPVRIGNGASLHVQLDIYGELMDSIYLFNKHGKPITYDQWVMVRKLIEHVEQVWQEPDMSIWEVRSKKENFTYSKIMLWVAFDRALRLAEKRNFPCPQRQRWLTARDSIYELIMEKGFNKEMNSFIQSFESDTQLDASSLMGPLVFFVAPNDPRFLGTLDRILKAPSKGGLTSAGFVFRYDTDKVDDGVGGAEGTFTICTMWLIEALTRASKYQTGLQAPNCAMKHKTHPHKQDYLRLATDMFENVTSFANHLGLFSEEIAVSGEQLGNTPQAFSHLAYVSAALNLERARSE